MTAFSINTPLQLPQIRLLLALFSMLLSAYALISDDIINSDGILYIQMAEAYLQGGLSAMASLYDWPFFSLIIGIISQLTNLYAETSAALLNAVLFVIFTDALLLIARHLLPAGRQLFIAALLILFFYSINDYRDFIIRDIGYWAFISLALLHFLNFLKDQRLQSALLWQTFGLVALLFRIEASIILLAMPLFLLFIERQQPVLKSFLQLYSLLLVISLLAPIAMIMIAGGDWINAFGKLGSIGNYLDFGLIQNRFDAHAELIAKQILHPVAEDEAGRVLFFGLTGMLAMELFLGLSAAYILILLLGWKIQTPLLTGQLSKALVYFLIINIVLLVIFSFYRYFVSSRYCVMAFVALFLLVLPRLTRFIDEIFLQRKRALQALVVIALVYSLGDVAYRSNSKNFIPETAKWAAQQLPPDSKVLTLDEFSTYYFHKYANTTSTIKRRSKLDGYKYFDYLLLVEKRRNLQLKSQLASLPVKTLYKIENKRGDKAVVYQVLKP